MREGVIADETPGCVSVETQHKHNEQVMSVPESLEALLADLCVRGGEHQQHAEQHDMSGNTAGVGIMDLQGVQRPHLRLFHVEEAADIQSVSVQKYIRRQLT